MSDVFYFPSVLWCVQGSVAQLREVWEETDGLDPQEFNPKTFFKLHGECQHFLFQTTTLMSLM